MYEVGAVGHFHASHALRGNFGPAGQRHDHDYRVEAAAFGHELRTDGTLFDITLLQRALQDAARELDGHHLNDVEPFVEDNPTAEVVAHHIWDRISNALEGHGLSTLQVRLWESPEAYAAVTDQLL